MKTGRSNPLPDGIESVALGMAVGAGLSFCGLLLTLFTRMEMSSKAVDASIASLIGVLLAGLSWGLFHQEKWAWRASFVLCLLLTLLGITMGVLLAITLATEGFGRPHGVTAAGQCCLCVLIPLEVFLFGLPTLLLWRDRNRL